MSSPTTKTTTSNARLTRSASPSQNGLLPSERKPRKRLSICWSPPASRAGMPRHWPSSSPPSGSISRGRRGKLTIRRVSSISRSGSTSTPMRGSSISSAGCASNSMRLARRSLRVASVASRDCSSGRSPTKSSSSRPPTTTPATSSYSSLDDSSVSSRSSRKPRY